MANFYVGEVLFETGGTIDTPGDITVTSILDCAGTTGTAGQILSSTGTALLWTTAGAAGIPCSILTAKGDIVVATGASTPTALPVGTNGQVLTACSACTTGLVWTTPAGASAATPSVSGTVFGCANATNAVIGSGALAALTTGTCNAGLGVAAFPALTSGCYNIALGDSGGSTITSGCYNVAIGSGQSVSSPTGNCQLAIGPQLGFSWLTGDSTMAIKPGAGIIDCAGSCGTAGQALLSNGSNAVCWGTVSAAKACPTTLGTVYGYVGTNFKTDASIGVGLCSMVSSTPVNTPTNAALGFGTLCSLTTGGGNVAMGWRSLITMTTGNNNTAVGSQAGAVASGTDNVFVGGLSGCGVTGNQNAFFGTSSGCTQTSGDANVAIGPNVALASTTGSCQLAIGFSATDNWLTGNSTKAIKPGAGIIDCAGSCGTAGQVLSSNGSNAIEWITAGGGGGIPDSTLTAKGDLITATAASTPVALPAGTDGQVLYACSTESSGLIWATPQTYPYVTYETAVTATTTGVPITVFKWSGGSFMEGSVTAPTFFNLATQIWEFYLSGDPTNLSTGWLSPFQWPASGGVGDQGAWSVDFPVYPDPDQNLWVVKFTPAVDYGIGQNFKFTFTYKLNGSPIAWQL